MIVVSLAPEQSVAVPAEAVAVPDLGEPPAPASAVESWISEAPAVQFAATPVTIARVSPGRLFPLGAPVASEFVPSLTALSPEVLAWSRVTGGIATATMSQGAGATPRERDGHREVAPAAEPRPPSAAVSPPGPFDDQGPGASGGSAGGAPGSAASSRYFAIATTPMRFEFPSSFAHAPLPSSVPEGALEDAPTTRPG